jgi:phosphoenolpyruvate-protein kinase (PTS system EI component)
MVEIPKLSGVGASEGVAVGPAFVHAAGELEPERKNVSEDAIEEELERFRRAVEVVVGKLSETSERLSESGSEEEAAIFEAHVELAEDPELSSGVEERVRDLESPEAAVLAVGEGYASELAAMEDEYLSARADDVRDVARQIAAELMGRGAAELETLEVPSVIVARSLAPSDTARTRDGRRIEVSANLGSASEAEGALDWGAEGVGLFRTEFLFMEGSQLPSEDEQYEAYAAVARVFGEKPVIVRTLDVGGDKDLPGVDQPEEENPFLGWRGIRMCLDVPGLFKPQLRAILRAGASGNLKVMFPMISDVEELRAAKKVFDECREELENEGQEIGRVEVGIMVETPAAAICAAHLAPEVSFFSIGTNDLVQYTLAADRGNERLRHLQGADHPAVLELVRMTCEAAREQGIWVGVCGEAAGEVALIPKLVELGVTELSMSAPSIPQAKKVVSEL